MDGELSDGAAITADDPSTPEPPRRDRAALALLIAITVLASLPALAGGYVYDDERMVANAAMDDVADLAAVPFRTSAAYLSDDPTAAVAGGSTWRPTAMFGLVAVQALAPSPLPHHLVSLALHLLTVCLLFLAVPRRSSAWTLAVGLFAVHPALGEAWLWINGRADLTAGLCLAGLFFVSTRDWKRPLVPGLAALGLALLGTGAKETFVPGAAVMIVALAVRGPLVQSAQPRSSSVTTGQRSAALGASLGIGLGLVARALVVVGGSGVTRLLSAPVLGRMPALVGLGAETLLLPFPRPMRSLSYALDAGSVVHLLFAGLVAVGAAALARRRQYRALLLVGAGILCLLPTAVVADVAWLGFDRYLYPSAVLLVAAIATTKAPALRVPRWPALGLIAASAVALGVTGSYYASPSAFSEARAEHYPDDPDVILDRAAVLARAGQTTEALATIEALPARLPPATAHQAAHYLHLLGRSDLVVVMLEDVYRRHPDNAFVRYDMIELRGAQGRFDDALSLARDLQAEPAFCKTVDQLLGRWLASGRLPAEVLSNIESVRSHGDCID